MRALQVELRLSESELDAIDPILEDSGFVFLRTAESITIYFEESREEELRVLIPFPLPNPEEASDWKDTWQEEFTSAELSSKITVAKPGFETEGALVIEAGFTFGFGTHQTSRIALSYLEEEKLSGKVVFDIGCGSGVLALSAAKLGASRVLGTDIDPEAVRVSEGNAERNDLLQCEFKLGSIPESECDLLVMNIISSVQRELLPVARERVRPGGVIILSGFLAEEEFEIPFGKVERRELDGWAGYRIRV